MTTSFVVVNPENALGMVKRVHCEETEVMHLE